MSVAASGDSTGDSVVRSVSSGSSWVIEVDDWLSSACAFSSSGRVSDGSDWQFSGRVSDGSDWQFSDTERMLSAMLLLRSDFVPSSSEEASPSAERGMTESKIDRSDWLGCEDAPTERDDSVSSYLYFRCGSV